jgi:hypothetical protein
VKQITSLQLSHSLLMIGEADNYSNMRAIRKASVTLEEEIMMNNCNFNYHYDNDAAIIR